MTNSTNYPIVKAEESYNGSEYIYVYAESDTALKRGSLMVVPYKYIGGHFVRHDTAPASIEYVNGLPDASKPIAEEIEALEEVHNAQLKAVELHDAPRRFSELADAAKRRAVSDFQECGAFDDLIRFTDKENMSSFDSFIKQLKDNDTISDNLPTYFAPAYYDYSKYDLKESEVDYINGFIDSVAPDVLEHVENGDDIRDYLPSSTTASDGYFISIVMSEVFNDYTDTLNDIATDDSVDNNTRVSRYCCKYAQAIYDACKAGIDAANEDIEGCYTDEYLGDYFESNDCEFTIDGEFC